MNGWERSFLQNMDQRFAETGAKTRLSDAQYRKLALILKLRDQPPQSQGAFSDPKNATQTVRPRKPPPKRSAYSRRAPLFSPLRTLYAPRRVARRVERQIMVPVLLIVGAVMVVSNLWPTHEAPGRRPDASRTIVTQAQPELSHNLYVSGSSVNQRQGPGTGNAIMGSLQRGAAVKVLGTEGGWTQIASPLGTGWMASNFLTSQAPSASPSVQTAGKLGRLVQAGDIRVIDGDTVSIWGERANVRLVGFNTPEISKPACQAEALAGRTATNRLREMLRSAKAIEFAQLACACPPGTQGTNRCNFGRKCGSLYVDGTDVGRKLIAEKLAAPYVCGKYRCPPRPGNWCG
ncbi:MAG: SH3 domain-containing protein [Celeribacter sp.]